MVRCKEIWLYRRTKKTISLGINSGWEGPALEEKKAAPSLALVFCVRCCGEGAYSIMDMEGSAPEETSFQFMSPRVLEIASKQEHAQYFEDVGLSGFCSRVSGENQRHSSADMSELIDNFDKVRGESKVKGIVVSFSVESVNAMFGLEDGRPAADKKGTKYVPTTFSPSKKGKNSGAYKLKGCTDELVKERLEFQLVALYLKGTRVESAASYQIEQVEGCLRADWGKCLTSRLVELLSKSQSSTGEKKRKPTCTFASHLQLILSRAVSPLSSAVQVTPMRAVGQHPSLLSAVQGTAQPVLPAHEASRCTECSEIREEFGVVRALMTEGHAEITTTVGELRKELATVKALYESLAKGLSECGTKQVRMTYIAEDMISNSALFLTQGKNVSPQDKGLLAAGAPRDFANLDFNEDATIAGTRPVSSVRENRARNSVSPVRGEDKEDDCKGRRARSLEGRATDKGLGRKSTPSSEAIGPRRDGSGTSMEEDTGE